MNNQIKKIEGSLDHFQEFIFNLRKFFNENPGISRKYEEFLEKKQRLIY